MLYLELNLPTHTTIANSQSRSKMNGETASSSSEQTASKPETSDKAADDETFESFYKEVCCMILCQMPIVRKRSLAS